MNQPLDTARQARQRLPDHQHRGARRGKRYAEAMDPGQDGCSADGGLPSLMTGSPWSIRYMSAFLTYATAAASVCVSTTASSSPYTPPSPGSSLLDTGMKHKKSSRKSSDYLCIVD